MSRSGSEPAFPGQPAACGTLLSLACSWQVLLPARLLQAAASPAALRAGGERRLRGLSQSILRASLGVWEAQTRRNSWALPLSFSSGTWEEDGKGLRRRRREGAEFSMSSCQNVISCIARAASLGGIN